MFCSFFLVCCSCSFSRFGKRAGPASVGFPLVDKAKIGTFFRPAKNGVFVFGENLLIKRGFRVKNYNPLIFNALRGLFAGGKRRFRQRGASGRGASFFPVCRSGEGRNICKGFSFSLLMSAQA